MRRKPPWRPCRSNVWRDPRKPFAVADRLDGLPRLRDDQAGDVLAARAAALPVVRAVLRGSPWLADEAEGLADQAAVEAVATFDGRGPLAGWAREVARYTSLGARKAAARVLARESSGAEPLDPPDDRLAEPLAGVDALADLDTITAPVPARFRGIFRALYDGSSVHAWATAHGVSSATAWRAFAAAREAMAARAAP